MLGDFIYNNILLQTSLVGAYYENSKYVQVSIHKK